MTLAAANSLHLRTLLYSGLPKSEDSLHMASNQSVPSILGIELEPFNRSEDCDESESERARVQKRCRRIGRVERTCQRDKQLADGPDLHSSAGPNGCADAKFCVPL